MFKTLCVALCTSLLMNVLFYCTLKQPKIATVDILSITSQFIKKEAQKNHSKAEKELAIQSFSHRLEQALSELSRSKSLVLVPREAVIKGSSDYTALLLEELHLESQS